MAEDSRQLSEEELQKLGDELIENLSGGYIHRMPNGEYEIINDRNGEVLSEGWYYNEYIEEYCKHRGVSAKMISDEDLDRLRRYRAIVGNGF